VTGRIAAAGVAPKVRLKLLAPKVRLKLLAPKVRLKLLRRN
jgi:hypothetical protein